jgi:hypothetical protein
VYELVSSRPRQFEAESLFQLVTLLEHLTERDEKC